MGAPGAEVVLQIKVSDVSQGRVFRQLESADYAAPATKIRVDALWEVVVMLATISVVASHALYLCKIIAMGKTHCISVLGGVEAQPAFVQEFLASLQRCWRQHC